MFFQYEELHSRRVYIFTIDSIGIHEQSKGVVTDMQRNSSQDQDWSKSGIVNNIEICDRYAIVVIGNVKFKNKKHN